MTTVDSSLRLLLLGIACAILIGCSHDGKTEIDGTVTWNGQPISNGYVELIPLGKGQIDGGDIVDGKFSLRTHEGEKRVTVIAQREIGKTQPTQREPNPRPILFQYIPPEFKEKSQLKVTVSSSLPELTIDLKGKERSSRPSPDDMARIKAHGG